MPPFELFGSLPIDFGVAMRNPIRPGVQRSRHPSRSSGFAMGDSILSGVCASPRAAFPCPQSAIKVSKTCQRSAAKGLSDEIEQLSVRREMTSMEGSLTGAAVRFRRFSIPLSFLCGAQAKRFRSSQFFRGRRCWRLFPLTHHRACCLMVQ